MKTIEFFREEDNFFMNLFIKINLMISNLICLIWILDYINLKIPYFNDFKSIIKSFDLPEIFLKEKGLFLSMALSIIFLILILSQKFLYTRIESSKEIREFQEIFYLIKSIFIQTSILLFLIKYFNDLLKYNVKLLILAIIIRIFIKEIAFIYMVFKLFKNHVEDGQI